MTSLPDMEARDSAEHLSKQLCSNCDASQAEFWCLDCDGSLCGACELAHRRVSLTRAHRLRNQPHSVARTLAAPVKYCRLHMSEPLELYCFTCDHFTCKDCQLTTHRSHSFEFVSKAVAVVRKRLQACVQPASAQRDMLTKAVKDMETRLEDILVNRAHLKSNLLNHYFSLVYGLKDEVAKIYQDVLDVYHTETEEIQRRLKDLKLLQQKHVAMTETSEQCKNVSDLQTLMNMKKQVESHVKDFQNQDLGPPSHMSRVMITSSKKLPEVFHGTFQVKVSRIPFSVQNPSQRADPPPPPPPPPAGPGRNLLPSTNLNFPSLDNLKPRGYTPRSSSSNPSSSSSTTSPSLVPPQTSSSTNPAPPCKNAPQSTSTSKAPLSLPRGNFIITSSALMNILRDPTQTGVTRSSSSSAFSFPPFTCSSVSSADTAATPAAPVTASGEQPRSTSRTAQSPHYTINVVPRSDLLSKHQTPLPQSTIRPVPPPQQAAPSQNQQPQVPPQPLPMAPPVPRPQQATPCQNQQPQVLSQPLPMAPPVPRPQQAAPSQNQQPGILSQPLPMAPPVPPPQQAAPSQNQQPGILSQPLPAVPPEPLPHQATPNQNQQPGASAPLFCLTNIYTPPTMLIPTKPPPCYGSQNPIVSFAMGPQINPVEGAFLDTLGSIPPTHQTLPVTCSLVPLGGSTFLQQSPTNQDSVVLGRTPSSDQMHVSKSRDCLLRQWVYHQPTKPAEDKPSQTTVLERTAEDEPTSTLPEETDSAEDEPTSTTADQPDPPPDEPSTTTSVEEDSKLITSTSGDIEFAEIPETPNANKKQPRRVIGRRCSKPDKRQLRLSLVRLPITPPTPGGPLPSFRLVHGDVENEIYLMEMTGSPAKAVKALDVTDPLNETGSELDFAESLDGSGSEFDFAESLDEAGSEFDFTEPLSSPESDVSVDMLSCSVCASSEALLICSACARGYHRECHLPPMGPDITPGWICSLCQDLSDPLDPYRSARLQNPLRRGLKTQDQRRCESLLLFLKVEGCSRLTEFAGWVVLDSIAERLRLHLEPPYRNTVHFVSDVWAVFRNSSQDAALKDLLRSFKKKVRKVLRHEQRFLDILLSEPEEDQSGSRPGPRTPKKRPRSILDTKTAKKRKKTT